MAIAEISIVPVGTHSPSFSSHVAEVCHMLDKEGVKYRITPTATVIEGDIDHILNAVKKIHSAPFDDGVLRVVTNVMIDDRRDKPMSLEGQVAVGETDLT